MVHKNESNLMNLYFYIILSYLSTISPNFLFVCLSIEAPEKVRSVGWIFLKNFWCKKKKKKEKKIVGYTVGRTWTNKQGFFGA